MGFCFCPVDLKVVTLIWVIYLQMNYVNLKLCIFHQTRFYWYYYVIIAFKKLILSFIPLLNW